MAIRRAKTSVPRPLDTNIRTRMRTTKRRDTGPEQVLRRLLHRIGLRYRVDVKPDEELRCRADLVFRRARVAVFVNGCFWHGCPLHATWPKNNAAWWRAKIEANRARDRRVDGELRARGWLPMRIWEHEPPNTAAARISRAVLERLSSD